MLSADAPIGVMDAGFGGYTVIRELQKQLPCENIVFFGDGKNQPYGNRSREEILCMTRQCLRFLQEKKVKAVAVACNTISTLIEEYQSDFPFRIFSIVRAGSDEVIALRPRQVVLFSTVFTAKSGCYQRYIREGCPEVQVIPQGSPWLARLIEDGDFDREKIEKELRQTLGEAARSHPDVDTLILGCTHFPLVADLIRQLYPQFTRMVNPAFVQAGQIKEYLEENHALRTGGEGSFHIYTTSDCETYSSMAEWVGLKKPELVELAPAPRMPELSL